MAHLPKFNITLIRETNDENNVKPLEKLKLKQVINISIKLIELSNSLNEINKELEKIKKIYFIINILHIL